jgi:hypothetical protein
MTRAERLTNLTFLISSIDIDKDLSTMDVRDGRVVRLHPRCTIFFPVDLPSRKVRWRRRGCMGPLGYVSPRMTCGSPHAVREYVWFDVSSCSREENTVPVDA